MHCWAAASEALPDPQPLFDSDNDAFPVLRNDSGHASGYAEPMPSVRVFVEHEGVLRRAMKLGAGKDASLYVHPIGPTKQYDYGEERFEANVPEISFDTNKQLHSADAPHLSIKRSGEVHIRAGKGTKAGPIKLRRLSDWCGEHVATVTATRVEAMPVYNGDRSRLSSVTDRICYFEQGVESGRLAIYVNGYEPTFTTDRFAFVMTVTNRTLPRPLYVAVTPWAQEPLGDDLSVIAIGGFDPYAGEGEAPFLFLRAT